MDSDEYGIIWDELGWMDLNARTSMAFIFWDTLGRVGKSLA